jgi:hypothetical protein
MLSANLTVVSAMAWKKYEGYEGREQAVRRSVRVDFCVKPFA